MPINTSMNRWSRIASNMDIETLSSTHRMGTTQQTPSGNPQFGKNITAAELASKTNDLPCTSGETFCESS